MPLKIVHQLTLMLVAAVLCAVMAVAIMVSWNLKGGFADFIAERDARQLQRFAGLVSEHAKEDPALEKLQGSFSAMRRLMDEFYRREGIALPSGPAGSGLPAAQTSHAEPGSTEPVDEPSGFAQRIQIFNRDGALVAGKLRTRLEEAAAISQPVTVEGRSVGTVRLGLAALPGIGDTRFLRRQYLGLLLAILATLFAAFAVATWMAGRWAGPLLALQVAAQAMGRGNFEMPELPYGGAIEISRLADDLRGLAKALRKLEKDRRQWIAELSHELRTPLTVLKGEIESLEDGARLPDPLIFKSLSHEVSQIARLVDDLHLLAMADLGALPIRRAPVELYRGLNELIERAISNQKLAGVDVVFERPPAGFAGQSAAEWIAWWDRGRVEQVLQNLLGNTAHHTSVPGRSRIAWRLCEPRQAVEIVLEDSAPGVSADKLEQIFEPLFRGDKSRSRVGLLKNEVGGSGLGLAIVRAIVVAHGGMVTAAPSPLGGLAVRVTLPLNGGSRENAYDDR